MGKTLSLHLRRPPASSPLLRRIRKWGDPVMVQYGFDIANISTTNFQAVKTYNLGNHTWGGVTNFLRIPRAEMQKVRDLQFPQTWEGRHFDQDDKMEWLCHDRGTIFMYENEGDAWETAPSVRWGTIGIGNNIVQVERFETLPIRWGTNPVENWNMARLVGFGPSDWGRPLEELLAMGLVHHDWCVYRNNAIGETPKGTIYSPFFNPKFYDFAGASSDQPDALYLAADWLEAP